MDKNSTAARLCYCLHPSLASNRTWSSSTYSSWSVEEWNAIGQLAARCWLLPLLYGQLKEKEWLAVLPLSLQEALARAYRRNSLRNLQLFQHLLPLLHEFKGANIPVILLKGAHLANFVYPEPALRTMGDVDILVAEENVDQAVAIMRNRGLLPSPHFSWERKQQYHTRFALPLPKAAIELHWHVHLPHAQLQIDLASLWTNAQRATVAGLPVQLLAREELLLHLCFHVAKHSFGYGGLRTLCDIAEVLTSKQRGQPSAHPASEDSQHSAPVNWQRITEQALEWRIQKQVHLALTLADELFHLGIPPATLAALRPTSLRRIYVVQAMTTIFESQEEKLSQEYIQCWHSPTWCDRANRVRRSWLLPRRQLAAMYSVSETSPWLTAYYLVRFNDLLRRYGLVTLQMLRGNQMARRRVQTLSTFIPWLHTP